MISKQSVQSSIHHELKGEVEKNKVEIKLSEPVKLSIPMIQPAYEVEDIKEESARLFEEVSRGDSRSLLEYHDGSRSERFLQLMHKKEPDGSNLLIFAITAEKYECVEIMLEILKSYIGESQSASVLLGKNCKGKNCLQLLLTNFANTTPTVNLSDIGQAVTCDDKRDCIRKVFNMLLNFKKSVEQLVREEISPDRKEVTADKGEPTAGKEDVQGGGIIFWAVRNNLQDFAKQLLCTLPEGLQLSIIEHTEECTKSSHYKKHDESCQEGYNLLMLALTWPIDELLIDAITDIIRCHGDQAYQCKVVMGKDQPEVFSQSENSLRLAAMHDGKTLVRLIRHCIPTDQQFKALLEVGPSGTAMSLLTEEGNIKTLKKLLKKSKHVERLRETLYDPAILNNFMQQAMRPGTIEFFRKIHLFHHSFLIPKPSNQISYIPFHHPFQFSSPYSFCSDISENMDNLINTFQSIGIKALKSSQTPFPFINCSLQVSCFTESSDQVIDENMEMVREFLPRHMPKVWIIPAHSDSDEIPFGVKTQLRKNNILLLSTNWSEEFSPKYSFIPKLAEKIKKTNGETSLQEIFMNVLDEINSEIQEEIPECETETFKPLIGLLSKKIHLRRYNIDDNRCYLCKEDIRSCTDSCMICSACYKWCHVDCVKIDKAYVELSRKPEFSWLCDECHANRPVIGM